MHISIISPARAEPLSLTEAKAHLNVDHAADDTLLGTLLTAAREHVESWTGRQLVASLIQAKMQDFPADQIAVPRPPLIGVDSITYVDTSGTTQTVTSTDYVVYANREPGVIGLAYGKSWPAVRLQPDAVTVNYRAGYACPFTANATTNVVTLSGRTPVDGERIQLWNRDGALPAGLSAYTDYYIIDTTGSTCKLSASSGGAEIDITGTGTGTHFVGLLPQSMLAALKLLISDLYEHREAQMEIRLERNEAVARLLWPYRLLEV